MKKIPTLFKRTFDNHKMVSISDKVTPGMEWVLEGKGVATIKLDGSCCAIINGKFYKRYDAKNRKKVPAGSIPCCDPDPVTGHHPHWVKVDPNNPADKWYVEAYKNKHHSDSIEPKFLSGYATYEAVGPHFNGNPYELTRDTLHEHGSVIVDVNRTFEGVKKFLEEYWLEGLVFWLNGEPVCKIKRSDFGLPWGEK